MVRFDQRVFSPADESGQSARQEPNDAPHEDASLQNARPKTGGFVADMALPHQYSRTTDVAVFRNRADAATLAFYDYWDSKRLGRPMPARSDLDPIEMVHWLKGIQIIEAFHNPRRLKYRLVGELEVESRGFNPTGRWVEDGFIGISKEDTLNNYNTVIDQRSLLYNWGEYVCGGGFLRWQETVFLPLSSDGDVVDRVITYTVTRSL